MPVVRAAARHLSDASFRNAQQGGMDFRINNAGPGMSSSAVCARFAAASDGAGG